MPTVFDLDKFRMGIFNLSSARFGKVAKLMIQQLYDYSDPENKYYNLYDPSNKFRVEVGFSRAVNKPPLITKNNAISEIYNSAANSKKVIIEADLQSCIFRCNIQQLKLTHFDVLYYGIFFFDTIYIFKALTSELPLLPGFCSKQHESSIKEAQMGLTHANLDLHKKLLITKLSYQDLYSLLS